MTNARDVLSQYRRLTPNEAAALGISPKAERRIAEATGQIVTRRQYENIKAAVFEIPGGMAGSQSLSRKARSYGFQNIGQLRALQSNEMYGALERMYSLNAGGIPENQIRNLEPIADAFNRALGNVIQSGEWKFRRDPDYAKFGRGLTTARAGPNVRHLFEVVGTDSAKADAEQRAFWLRMY